MSLSVNPEAAARLYMRVLSGQTAKYRRVITDPAVPVPRQNTASSYRGLVTDPVTAKASIFSGNVYIFVD